MSSISPNSDPSAVEVFYGPHKLVPGPLIDFSLDSEFDELGSRSSNVTRITLNGSIIILPSGSYEQLNLKQNWFKDVFATDYLDFVILAGANNKTLPSGTIIASGLRPKVNSISISPDIHVMRFDYSVELEDESIPAGVSGITSSLSNQWSFSEDESTCTLQVTHNVSATGPEGRSDKFDQALQAVKPLLGIDKLPLDLPYFAQPNFSGLFNATHPSNPNGGPVFEVSVKRQESADVANGTYSVTEVFQIVSGVPFFFSSKNEQYSEDRNGIATVTINGSIKGLGRTLDPSHGGVGGAAFERACSGFFNVVKPSLPSDASGVYTKFKLDVHPSGLNINNPTSYSVTQNKCLGTIDFSVTYTDDPANNLPSGIVSKSCSVQRSDAMRVYASHPIPFRRFGNLIQDIKTTGEGTVTIQCQAQSKNTGNQTNDLNRAINFIQDEVNRLRVVHANQNNFVSIRLTNLSQQQDPTALSCSATATYTFTIDLNSVQSSTSDIFLETV